MFLLSLVQERYLLPVPSAAQWTPRIRQRDAMLWASAGSFFAAAKWQSRQPFSDSVRALLQSGKCGLPGLLHFPVPLLPRREYRDPLLSVVLRPAERGA